MKKLLLLGAGRIGQVHARNIHEHPRATLHSIVDVNTSAARALAQTTGAKVVDNVESALADPELNGVLICTSTDTHVDLIERAARRGLPIFCEKPVDLDLKKVDACLAEVKARNVPLLMGFNRRFDPSFHGVRERVRAGEIGVVETLKITSRDPSPPPPTYVKSSGGLFRDMMIHDFDMARYLLPEEPVEVFAVGSVLVDPEIGKAGDIDTAMVILTTASGQLAHIENSRRAAYGYDQRVEVFGSKGMLQAHNPVRTSVVSSTAAGTMGDKLYPFFLERYADAYRAELDHFLEVLEGRQPPVVDGRDGRAALVLANAAEKSMKEGKPVKVALA